MRQALRRAVVAAIAMLGAWSWLPMSPVDAAPQVVFANGAPVSLDIGKGVVVRLDGPCSSVFISDPAIADVQLESPTMLSISAKSAGQATVYAIDAHDKVLLNSVVDVHQDVGLLQQQIKQLVPGSAVIAKSIGGAIVLTGQLKDAAEGDDIRKLAARYVVNPANLVDELTLDKPNQINLQVRVAEVSRTALKQFGINWNNIQASAGGVFGFASAVPVLAPNATAAANGVTKIIPGLASNSSLSNAINAGTGPNSIAGFNVPTPTLLGNASNNNLFASFRSGDFMINALIDALAQQGLITILAEPNLTTVSGQKASFLAGGEFPVPVPQAGVGTAATVTIDWKQFGVSLNFTPTILGNDRIALHVAPEVSELAPQQGITLDGVSVPGITTRRADTTVELGSGQSFVIAGLLQNETQQQLQAFPWIGDLPVIGALFRSTAFQRGESELVIIVTPYLVQPVATVAALQTGMEGFRAPTDADRVLNGQLDHETAPGAAPAPAPSTPAPIAPPAAPIQHSRASLAGFELE